MTSNSLLRQILASSVSICNRSGEIIRDILSNGRLDIVVKSGVNDIQTLADRSASDVILSSFSTQYPNLLVISEEGQKQFHSSLPSNWIVVEKDQQVLNLKNLIPSKYDDIKEEDLTIWVDPLDGTKEYTEGHETHVTVLIGIALGAKAIAGVIHQPFYGNSGRTLYGVLEGSSNMIPTLHLPSSKIITTSRSHGSNFSDDIISSYHPSSVLKVGGAGYKVLLLLEGKASYYVFPSGGCKKWDTCAPEAILKALGGNLTNVYGKDYEYSKNVEINNQFGVLASGPGLNHEDLVKSFPIHLLQNHL